MCVNQVPVLSNELEFIVNETETVSIEIGAESLEVCSGSEITIATEVTNGGESPVYIWMVNSQNQNHNNATYTYTPANGDKVICNLIPDIACPSETMVSSTELEIVVNTCTSVDVTPQLNLSVYPNPTDAKITVEMPIDEKISSIKVIALNGKEMLRFDYRNPKHIESIDLSSLQKGVYILQIQGDKENITKRIVKR